MTDTNRQKPLLGVAAEFLELVYHSIVRDVRKSSGNAAFGILKETVQILSFFAIFFVMFKIMGRSIAIRGDFFLFLMSGIFLLVVHMGAMSAVMSASNAISPIMQHTPMSVALAIMSSSIAKLYLQIVAIVLILFFLVLFSKDLTIYNPSGIFLPFIFTWASGAAIGLTFTLVQPIAPTFFAAFSKFYMRAQMITSGKFIPAAYMPAAMVAWFDWNPLFHCIDQMRLAVFINYSREVSSMSYPIYFTMVFMVIGMMGEFWLRENLSKSKHS